MALAKLTALQRQEIQRRYAVGDVSQQSLADEFGTSLNAVRYAINTAKIKAGCKASYRRHQQARQTSARARYAETPRAPGLSRTVKQRDFASHLLRSARKGAKRYGVVFCLSKADIVIPETCPVYGVQLDQLADPYSPNLPSLDRVDSTEGYVPGNVRVISWAANRDKANLSVEQLLALAEYVTNHQKNQP